MGLLGSPFFGADLLKGYQDQQAESHKRRVEEGLKQREQLSKLYDFHINAPDTPPDVKERLLQRYANLTTLPFDKKIPKELMDPSTAFAEAMKARVMPKPPGIQSPTFATSEGTNTVGGGARWGLGTEGAPPEEFNLGSMGGMRENPSPLYTQRADKLTNPAAERINIPSVADYAAGTLEPARQAYSQDMAGYTPSGHYTPERAAQEQGRAKGIAAGASMTSQMEEIADFLRARGVPESRIQEMLPDMVPGVSTPYQRNFALQNRMLSVKDEAGNLLPVSAYWNPNQGQQGYYFADGPYKDKPVPPEYQVVATGQMRLMPTGMAGNVMAVDAVGNPLKDTGMTRPRVMPRIVMDPLNGRFSLATPGSLPTYDPNSPDSSQAVDSALQQWAMNGIVPATPQLKNMASQLATQRGIVILGDKERTMLKDMYTAQMNVGLIRDQFMRMMNLSPDSEEFAQAAAELQNTVDALRASFSRGVFAERGVLTEGDVRRSGALLPGLTSAVADAVAGIFPNYNLNNLDTITQIIDNSQQALFSVHSMYNTMGHKVAGVDYSSGAGSSQAPNAVTGTPSTKWGDWKP